jgi:hypothetical protein
MKQYLKWILNDTLFGDVFIVSHCFNARNVFFDIFKYYRIVKGKLGRKIHRSNKNRKKNPEKGHLVPFKWFSSYQYAVFAGIAERMLRRRELKEPE